MFSHWSRSGIIAPSNNHRKYEGTIRYKNTYPGSVLVRWIEVEYSFSENLIKFIFFPNNYKETALLKEACIISFTNDEQRKFISPDKLDSHSTLTYLKIRVGTEAMGEKLIAFCHSINKISDKVEFSDSLILDFKNIILGILSSISTYQNTAAPSIISPHIHSTKKHTTSTLRKTKSDDEKHIYYRTPAYTNLSYGTNDNFDIILAKEHKTNTLSTTMHDGEKQIYYCTPAYINPSYDANINFDKIIPTLFTKKDFDRMFQRFRNGFDPNYRDVNGATLLYKLVSMYIKQKSSLIFDLIELTLIYGGNLFILDNGPYLYFSAASIAIERNAHEILNLVLLKDLRVERPLKITSYEQKLNGEIIEIHIALDNKKTYQIDLMTMNQFNKRKVARSAVFELFKIMYKNSDPATIEEEFEDSFSDDDQEKNELTLIFLILSHRKIVGFTVYNIASTLTVDLAFLLPEVKLGGLMAFIILMVCFSLYASIKELHAFACWAATSHGMGVFTKPGAEFYWPKYNIEGMHHIIKKLIQAEENLQLTTHGIGIQRIESLKMAGHKIVGLEPRFLYRHMMGLSLDPTHIINVIETSVLLIFPPTLEFFYNVIKNAKKYDLDFFGSVRQLTPDLSKLTSKIPEENHLYKLLTLPTSPSLFALAPDKENNEMENSKNDTTFYLIRSKL